MRVIFLYLPLQMKNSLSKKTSTKKSGTSLSRKEVLEIASAKSMVNERARVKVQQQVQSALPESVRSAPVSGLITHETKCFIVEYLACYQRPKDTIKAVREIFGIEVTRQQLQCYDSTKANGRALSGNLKTLFFDTRHRRQRGRHLAPSVPYGGARTNFLGAFRQRPGVSESLCKRVE